MSAQQDIQHCIQQCQQTASQLRNMANAETDINAKKALFEGAHHLDLCITECQFTVQNV